MLRTDYLAEAIKIGQQSPHLGTWGSGAINPEFELQPPPFVEAFLATLALRNTHDARWANYITLEATPWGAGLCVRREVAHRYCLHCEQTGIRIVGHQGKSTMSGEDIEISHIACEMGLGVGVFPELALTHLIPRDRLSLSYLLKVFEDSETSRYVMTYKWDRTLPKNPYRPWGCLSIMKNIALTRSIDRKKYLASVRAITRARRFVRELSP